MVLRPQVVKAIQPTFTILNIATGPKEEEEEADFKKPFIELKQRQKKADLKAVLGSLPKTKQYQGLKISLSSKSLSELGLNELEAIAIVNKLSEWAGDPGTQTTFATWEAAVLAARDALGVGHQQGNLPPTPSTAATISTGPSELEKVLGTVKGDKKDVTVLYEYCDKICRTALQRELLATEFLFILDTGVSIHGSEQKSGAKVSSMHLKRPAQILLSEGTAIMQTIAAAPPVALFVGSTCEVLLLNFMKRIMGGSVAEGKCGMMLRSMTSLASCLQKICLPRFSTNAIAKIKEAVKKGFWGVEPKVAVKLCRELTSAIYVLDQQPQLILLDCEVIAGKGEFDLKFGVDETHAPLFLDVESEGGLFGNKATGKQTGKQATKKSSSKEEKEKKTSGPEYYAERWSNKAKLFRSSGLHGTLYFMISYHPGLNEEIVERIRLLAKKKHGENLEIVFSGGTGTLPIPVQVPVTNTNSAVPTILPVATTISGKPNRGRSQSLGHDTPLPQVRARSKSLSDLPT